MRSHLVSGNALVALGVLAAGGSPARSGAECSLVGGPTGVRLEIRPPLAAEVGRANG
jgi:hypothetical protein